MTLRISAICVVFVAAGGVAMAAAPADTEAIEAAAHGTYVAAINSNNIETFMADLTDGARAVGSHDDRRCFSALV